MYIKVVVIVFNIHQGLCNKGFMKRIKAQENFFSLSIICLITFENFYYITLFNFLLFYYY